jgi:hypothetical protein
MAGDHTYNNYRQSSDDPFMSRVRSLHDGNIHPADLEEKQAWLKEAHADAVAADPNSQRNILKIKNAEAFVVLHPEVHNTRANGLQLAHECKRMFGDVAWTVPQYEAAYESLQSSGLLGVNRVEAEKQRKAALRTQAERIKAAEPTMEDLYSMPLEDLRRLDAVANSGR